MEAFGAEFPTPTPQDTWASLWLAELSAAPSETSSQSPVNAAVPFLMLQQPPFDPCSGHPQWGPSQASHHLRTRSSKILQQ